MHEDECWSPPFIAIADPPLRKRNLLDNVARSKGGHEHLLPSDESESEFIFMFTMNRGDCQEGAHRGRYSWRFCWRRVRHSRRTSPGSDSRHVGRRRRLKRRAMPCTGRTAPSPAGSEGASCAPPRGMARQVDALTELVTDGKLQRAMSHAYQAIAKGKWDSPVSGRRGSMHASSVVEPTESSMALPNAARASVEGAPTPGLTPPTGQKRPRLHAQRPQSALLRGTARGRREPSMRRYPQRIAALLAETPGMGIR